MTGGSARAIVFDLFHTLVDPEEFRPPAFRRVNELARILNLPLARFETMWDADAGARQVTLKPTVLERVQEICRDFGVSPAPEVWPQVDDILGRYTDRAILNPHRNVVLTLEHLKGAGWTIGLLSNCDEREKRSWASSALAPLFDGVAFSCEIGFAKPSVEAYRSLIPRWGGIPLESALFVGDGANDELAGARRAGFSKVVFQSGFVSVNGLRPAAANERLRNEADLTVNGIEELIDLVPGPA